MRTWTAQTRADVAPVLVVEGSSFWAFLFGPIWLAWHGAWIFAALGLLLDVAVGMWAPLYVSLGLAMLYGLFGNDLRRLALEWRGFTLVQVIAARDADAAFARLLAGRPDLASEMLNQEAARR